MYAYNIINEFGKHVIIMRETRILENNETITNILPGIALWPDELKSFFQVSNTETLKAIKHNFKR